MTTKQLQLTNQLQTERRNQQQQLQLQSLTDNQQATTTNQQLTTNCNNKQQIAATTKKTNYQPPLQSTTENRRQAETPTTEDQSSPATNAGLATWHSADAAQSIVSVMCTRFQIRSGKNKQQTTRKWIRHDEPAPTDMLVQCIVTVPTNNLWPKLSLETALTVMSPCWQTHGVALEHPKLFANIFQVPLTTAWLLAD